MARMRAFNKTVIYTIAGLILNQQAMAGVVSDIEITGLKRVELSTVVAYLPFRVGQDLQAEQTDQTLKNLFNTGFFKDVQIEQTPQGLVKIGVQERPAIAQIDFIGMTAVPKNLMKKALRSVALSEGRFYDPSLVEKAEQALKDEYVKKSQYNTKIKSVITPLEDNKVTIVFEVDEGTSSKITDIKFSGNTIFDDSDLLNEMRLSPTTWFSWYTQSNVFNKNVLNEDLENLRQFYLGKGYLDFTLNNVQTTLSENKKDMQVQIELNEGKRYKIGGVKVSGDLLGKDEEIKKLITVNKDDWYSDTKISEINRSIVDVYAKYGYALASIAPKAQSYVENNQAYALIELEVKPGRRAYVRQINIDGNDKTRDAVIRRELRQVEQSWYSPEKISNSEARIKRLGYFGDVRSNLKPVAGMDDKVDLDINVQEQATGQFNFGIGFSSTDKIILQTALKQDNFMGTGNSLGIEANTSKSARTLAVSHVDPYITQDGISRSTDIYTRTYFPLYGSGDQDFRVRTTGTSVRFGVPIGEYDTIFVGTGFDRTQLKLTENAPLNYQKYVNGYTKDGVTYKGFGTSSNNVPITIGWGRDSRDSSLVPNKGRYQQLQLEVGTPAADLRYYKASYQHQHYYPVSKGFTVASNLMLDYGKGYGGRPYPIFKNFYAGGIGSVRGYETSSLGPRGEDGKAEGGTSRIIGNVELIFPLAGTGYERTLRLFTFLDAGNVYAEGIKNIKFKGDAGLRYSYGVGLSWISPIGPLKLSLGYPIGKRKATDQLQRFQFQVGTAF